MNFKKYSKIVIIIFLFIIYSVLIEPSKMIYSQDSRVVRERIEIRDPNGKVITTFGPESRDLFLHFADCIAKEYKLSMHTIQLEDGVAIQFGARLSEDNLNNQGGLDREITLTVSNGNIKRVFRFNESEINRSKAFEIWSLMGYRIGLSTGGDKWSVSRKTYVPPEPHIEELDTIIRRFISASVEKDTENIKELFSDRVHFAQKDNPDSFDHITNEQAAKRFIKEYPANQIYVLRWALGTEGQNIIYLAAESEDPSKAKWCIALYSVKEKGKNLFKHLHIVQNFSFPGEKMEKDK